MELLEFCVREHLNKIAHRMMVVFDPLKLVITNYGVYGDPDNNRESIVNGEEILKSENNPEDPNGGTRDIPFSNELYIEREDFTEDPPKKWFRLAPGRLVRLKSAYIIKCDEVIKDDSGKIVELRCSYFPDSKSGHDTSGINVKGTLQWVSVKHAITAEVRLYDRLFNVEDPSNAAGDFKDHVNPDSLKTIKGVFAEPALAKAKFEERYQFIRKGYFCLDKDSSPSGIVFNRTVTLKDSWSARTPSEKPGK
jgi:glutaminyl-tRNA synthetase